MHVVFHVLASLCFSTCHVLSAKAVCLSLLPFENMQQLSKTGRILILKISKNETMTLVRHVGS